MSFQDLTVKAELGTHYELAGGVVLMGAPWWVTWLEYVSVLASAIAAICGAILGIHAVWRLVARYRRPQEGRN